MKLIEKRLVVERRRRNALRKLGHLLRNGAHARFIFGRKKKRPQERAVYAIAKCQLLRAKLVIKMFREFARPRNLRLQKRVPMLRGILRI